MTVMCCIVLCSHMNADDIDPLHSPNAVTLSALAEPMLNHLDKHQDNDDDDGDDETDEKIDAV